MRVRPQERVWWAPIITLVDASGTAVGDASYEASFDGGATWREARDAEGRPGWLIAGTAYPGPGDDDAGVEADHILAQDVRPLVRVRDMPETVISDGPYITI